METFDELYYQEPEARRFAAKVTGCEKAEGGWQVTLDRTAFYPEGGGQPGDRGWLVVGEAPEGWEPPAEKDGADGGAGAAAGTGGDPARAEDDASVPPAFVRVLDAQKPGDDVWHLCDGELAPGTTVTGILDWTWRRDNMEAHTGEHVVSGIVHGLYGYENVGFHMGERCIEVDFDGVLTEEQARDVELRANAAVRADVPVRCYVPSPAELETLEYRSKKALEGPVRIVDVEGVDSCACCGTHVATTGQVGLIKILRVTTKKKKTRLELLCGRRALLAVEQEMDQLRATSNYLSVGDDEVLDAVKRLDGEKGSLKRELKQVRRQQVDQEVAGMAKRDGLLVRFEDAADMDELRYLAEQVIAAGVAPACAALAPAEGDAGRLSYVMASKEQDLRPACKELNGRLSGRGGGKPQMVQGSWQCAREEAEAALAEVLG